MLRPLLQTLLLTLLLSTVLTGIASAAPITFDLQNVTFSDGTTATGSFEFDPTNETYSAFDIVTSAGSGLPAFTFTPADSQSANGGVLNLLGSNENIELRLAFASPLSASASPDEIVLTGDNSYECLSCDPYRLVSSGSVVAVQPVVAATPEPSSIALLGTGLLGVAGVLRKRFV